MAYSLLIALLTGAAIVFIPLLRVKIFQPVQVVLQGDLPAYCYLDYKFDTPLTSIWDPEWQGYLITQPLLPGQHILSYDESHDVRCIQRLLVHDGDNIIKINWQKYSLPYTYLWRSYPKDNNMGKKEHYQTQYTVFDRATLDPITVDVSIDMLVKTNFIKQNAIQILLLWEIRENNKLISEGGRSIERNNESNEVDRQNEIIIQNRYVEYRYQIYIEPGIIRSYIITSYVDFKQ
jgi:hypothetical protein